MAESLSRLHNPRRPEPESEPKGEAEHAESTGEHDHMHAAAEAMHQAEPSSKHMIMSHDGMGMRSHSVDERGNHEEHEDQDAHAHVKRFMGTDEGEEGDEDGDEEEPEEDQSIY